MSETNQDKLLSDKIVALGVAHTKEIRATDFGENPRAETIYILNTGPLSACNPKQFIRDWRVAGALIEKCGSIHTVNGSDIWWASVEDGAPQAEKECCPQTIIVACVEFLERV